MRRYLPLTVVAIAFVSALSIIYWGLDDDDDDSSSQNDFIRRIEGVDSQLPDFRLNDLDLRRAQETLVVADDLLDWARSGPSDDDALAELYSSCDGVFAAALLLDTSPPQATHIQGVAIVCADVHAGVARKLPREWAAQIAAQVPTHGYPYSEQGRPAVLARLERIRTWAENVLAARIDDTDYVRRFCDRETADGFGLPVGGGEADREAAIELAKEMRDLCTALSNSPTAVELAERIDPDRAVPLN